MTDAVDRTTNLKFPLPDFNKTPWTNLYYEFVQAVDVLMSRYFTINNYDGVWLNETAYTVGQRVIDPDLATLWECAVAHTSVASPILFAADRATNGTYWTVVDTGTGIPTLTTANASQFLQVNSGGTALAYITAAALRTAIGLVIGTDVQAWTAVLDAVTASYTTAEETKLAGIEAAATADQTGAEIKSAYEVESNAYTDTKNTKLAGIEGSADVTDATNVVTALSGATLTGDLGGGGNSVNNFAVDITTYTDSQIAVIGNAGFYIRMNKGTANTYTVPPNSDVAFAIGTRIHVRQSGAGATTIAEGAGVTINTPETLVLAKQHATATLVKISTDEWDLMGNLTAA